MKAKNSKTTCGEDVLFSSPPAEKDVNQNSDIPKESSSEFGLVMLNWPKVVSLVF